MLGDGRLTQDDPSIKPIKKVDISQPGSGWVCELYELFAPVRNMAADYSEEEINVDIDRAIAMVRRSHIDVTRNNNHMT
jgi:hypothetical protein